MYSQYGECASCVAAASCPAAELLGVSGEQQDVRPSPAQGTPLHYSTPDHWRLAPLAPATALLGHWHQQDWHSLTHWHQLTPADPVSPLDNESADW